MKKIKMNKKVMAFTLAGALGVSALGVSAGSFGLYKGDGISNYVNPALSKLSTQIEKYESNENSLLGKIASIKEAGSDKIESANEVIAERNSEIDRLEDNKTILECQISKLTKQLEDVNTELTSTKGTLATTEKNLTETKGALENKIKELNDSIATVNAKQALLNTANENNKTLTSEKANLQTELNKANAEYDKILPKAVEAYKTIEKNQPEADVSKVDTSLPEVNESATTAPAAE